MASDASVPSNSAKGLPLWLIRPRVKEYTGEPDPEWEGNQRTDPWEPWYDKAFGFLVAAPTEAEARRLATAEGGDELHPFEHNWTSGKAMGPERKDAWENPEYSVCWQIAERSTITEPKVVVLDFRRA